MELSYLEWARVAPLFKSYKNTFRMFIWKIMAFEGGFGNFTWFQLLRTLSKCTNYHFLQAIWLVTCTIITVTNFCRRVLSLTG